MVRDILNYILGLILIVNPTELALVRAIASSPDATMRELNSPSIGLNPVWLTTPAIQKFVTSAMEMSLKGQPISWLALVNAVPMSGTEREMIRAEWVAGKSEPTDWKPIISEIKTAVVKKDSDKAIRDYYHKLRELPSEIRKHLNTLGMEISFIVNDGEGYSPLPSAHLHDTETALVGRWGNTGLDSMFDGGRPNHGLIVFTAPTGFGKTCFGRTIAAHTVAYSERGVRCVVMTNEMSAGHYARGVLRALKCMWGIERDEVQLIADMDATMSIYDRVYTFEKVRQILYWEKPNVAILDSINAVAPPEFTSKYKNDSERHVAKADLTLQMCNEFGTLLYAPGNMSEAEQKRLRDKPSSVNSVMLFGSAAYQNSADWAFVSWRDKDVIDQQNVKRVKNRHGSGLGEVFNFRYDPVGSFYRS